MHAMKVEHPVDLLAQFLEYDIHHGNEHEREQCRHTDAADDGTRKLNAALQRIIEPNAREMAIVDLFSGGQLDLALNRPNVVHAALLAGPGSETLLARVKRLERFRTGNLPDEG